MGKINKHASGDINRPVALITGASRGLGRELAIKLRESGYRIVINYLSSREEALETADKAGMDHLILKADAGDLKQVENMVAVIEDAFGKLDAVINNAGITRDNLLMRQTEEEWDAVLRTNLRGCFNVIRSSASLMIRSGGGHIVNISSYAGVKGKAGQPAYSASKAALLGLTRTAAAELAEYNIMVNAVLPGYMMTEMGTKAEKAVEQAKKVSITRKLSDPGEVAKFIVCLLETENVTGQVFSLDSRPV